MSYVIQAVLSNAQHPEYGQVTIPFPIPVDQYDRTIEMLQAIELGYSVNRDCQVDGIDSWYSVLGSLRGTFVNVDQLDYLAKRLDSFDINEAAQFQAMAHKLHISDVKDFINLTFCCQEATVISDFSNLEKVGKSHYMNLHGGGASIDELDALDGYETALLLIDSGAGVVTPYGVVYDNGMKLNQLYNGRQFPAYFYDNYPMVLEVSPCKGFGKDQNPEYLYLPASECQIERTMLRAGICDSTDAQLRLDFCQLPDEVTAALELEQLTGNDLSALNRLCRVVKLMKASDKEKLSAVIQMAETSGAISVCHLAENLKEFDFIPGIHTPEEYGRYMIQRSGAFEYDETLDSFYDYQRYGEQRVLREEGRFNRYGYVAYHGSIALETLMREGPAVEQEQDAAIQEMGQNCPGFC